ncbi:hypothetical protein ACTZSU_25970, partial [Klebsiella pneumoniae]
MAFNPELGSTSPAVLLDNAERLDKLVNGPELTEPDRAGVELDTWRGMMAKFDTEQNNRESKFTASQVDKESRFQQFLNSSGYVFIGDYENGPFQFSARNQYIRYNNQYYRLNAATDVGFTTTGTDATSFANDVTHFVLMDGDTLRQNLGSSDGLKWIGKCKDLSTLRTIEPTISG